MIKKEVMQFESPRDHYRAEATVVWSNDDRFSLALQVFSERMGWSNFDLIKTAGPVKDLAENDSIASNFLIEQVAGSIKNNKSNEVFLMAHYNGGDGHEQLDASSEEDRYLVDQLRRAKNKLEGYLREHNLKAIIRLLLIDFKKIYELKVN